MAYRRTERVIQRFNERRDDIVQAAVALAAESGMEAVQIAQVAARAGIAAGTVYRYFPAKSDLVAALIGFIADRELSAIRRAARDAPGPLSALAAAIVGFAARAMREPRLMWTALAATEGSEADAARRAAQRALLAEFKEMIEAAVAGAGLPEQDAALAAASLYGMVMEALVGPLAGPFPDEKSARAAIQGTALIALRSIGVLDARARGLVVQAPWPQAVAAE